MYFEQACPSDRDAMELVKVQASHFTDNEIKAQKEEKACSPPRRAEGRRHLRNPHPVLSSTAAGGQLRSHRTPSNCFRAGQAHCGLGAECSLLPDLINGFIATRPRVHVDIGLCCFCGARAVGQGC